MLAASWVVRAAFVIAIGGDAHSLDVDYWRGALSAQDEGRNPYETGVLNWPPLWLMVIVAVDYVTGALAVDFWSGLRVYLVFVESVLVVALYFMLLSIGAGRSAVRRALLVGIALNPVAIILICQHGNSDVQVGLFVTLAMAALAAHQRSRDVLTWLAGCLFIGLGVLAKTAPLVLAPLLVPGARLISWSGRLLGLALLLGPAALGVGVILALAPSAVLEHVLGYRSTRGFFGLSGMVTEWAVYDVRFAVVTAGAVVALAGLLALWRRSPHDRSTAFLAGAAILIVAVVWLVEMFDRLTSIDARTRYATGFTLAVAALVVWLCYRLWREPPLAPPQLFLLVSVIFMTVVAFGPGYGAQYAYWFIPALIGTYVLLDGRWRSLLRVAWVVAALTYGIEYGVVSFLGAWAVAMFGSVSWMVELGEYLSVPERWVIFRIPLFVVYLVVIAEGIGRLARPRELR